DVGHSGPRLRHGSVPRLQRLGARNIWTLPQPHRARGGARHRRPRGLDRGSDARGQAGLSAPDAALQADLGRARRGPPELQPANVRPALDGDPGREPARHLPRLHRTRSARVARQRRRGDQLRVAFAVTDHRTGREPVRLGRVRALPSPARGHHRGRHRLDPVVSRRHGRGVPQASLLGAAEAVAPAQRVLPRALLGLVPGGSRGPRAGRADGPRRSFHVGQRLPASRGYVATFRRGHRAHHGPSLGDGAGERARPERGALLRLRGAGADMNVVDADGHVLEPADTWLKYLHPQYRDRAIRIARDEHDYEVLLIDGQPLKTLRGQLGALGGIDMDSAKLLTRGQISYAEGSPPGASDPGARLRVMDAECIDAVLLYPTIGICWEGHVTDGALATAYTRAYNRWLAEFCRANPARLYPVAHISLLDPEGAVEETIRARRDGCVGIYLSPDLAARGGRHFDHRHRVHAHRTPIRMPPSAYFYRQCLISPDPDESVTAQMVERLGADYFVWASDYPHIDASFGVVRELKERLAPLPEEARRK